VSDNLIGQQVGDYTIVEQLGEGGMGMVFKGQHTALGQIVAVKSLHTALMGNQQAKDRFIREAQALARLNHPNIISLLNFINDPNGCYIIMEYAEGEDLEHKIQRMNIIPPDQAIPWFVQACRGLSYANQQGIIHRDIKPSNIIVHPSGTTKLLDFGTAKLVDAKRLTQQGMTLGTIIYMSKEQLLGKPLDARSDVYSLGVTLYECVAGQLPFYDENERTLVRKIAKEEPIPPSQHYPGISPNLEAVILKSMAKDPDQRFQTATEMEAALTGLLGGAPSGVTSSGAAPVQVAPAPVAPAPVAPAPVAPAPVAPAPVAPAPVAPAAGGGGGGGGGSLILNPLFIAAMGCFILCVGGIILGALGSGGASLGGWIGGGVLGVLGLVLAVIAVASSSKGGQAAAAGPAPAGGAGLCPTCNRALLPGMAACPFCNPGAMPPPQATGHVAQPAAHHPPPAPAPLPPMPGAPPPAPAPGPPPMPMPMPVGTINVNSANAAQQYGAAPSISTAGVSAPASGLANLKIIDGNDKGQEYQVAPNSPVTLGRAPDCTCTLNDMGISSHHATVAWDQTGLFVQDAGSRNGVFVNNQRIQKHNLQQGDLIVMGSTRILVNL
jgi:eukaryotic-like serine/threonine-protein kinase